VSSRRCRQGARLTEELDEAFGGLEELLGVNAAVRRHVGVGLQVA
jgi:hypothetical protein